MSRVSLAANRRGPRIQGPWRREGLSHRACAPEVIIPRDWTARYPAFPRRKRTMPDARVSNTIFGRDAFLRVLGDEGVVKMFGNPGTTELPIMHALSSAPEMGYVLGLQEAVVIAMADGYARASGKLVSCNVHVAPGLGNAIGSIYTSFVSGTPMIVTAGQQEQGHGLTEPLLYAPLVPI